MDAIRSPSRRFRGAFPLGVGLAGLLMAHHPMMSTGFRRLQSDEGDGRLIHYLLEHGYRWASRRPLHREFWSPPFFYPETNVAALSDALLGVGPAYWLFRATGASPDLAYGLWMVTMSVLNYAAALMLFGRGLRFSPLAASAAAFLAVFSATRLNQMGHLQMLPCFYVILAIHALVRLFEGETPGRRSRWTWWLVAACGLVAQLYTGVYLGWFLILSVGLAGAWALVLPRCRATLLRVVVRDAGPISMAVAVGALLLVPFLEHYLPVARRVKAQDLTVLVFLHPHLGSWLSMGEGHWIWGWVPVRDEMPGSPFHGELRLGIGYFTPIACAVGLYLGRSRAICRLAALVGLVLWASTTYLPGEWLEWGAFVIAYLSLLGLFKGVDDPAGRWLGLAIVILALMAVGFPNRYLQAIGLTALVLSIMEATRARRPSPGLAILGLGVAFLCWKLLFLEALATGLMFGGPIAAVVAYLVRWGLGPLFRMASIGTIATAMLIAYPSPSLPILSFAWAPAAVPLSLAPLRLPMRPPTWILVRALIVSLSIGLLFSGTNSLWLKYHAMIPGSVGIRAIGRLALILTIPAALGLAILVDHLQARRRSVLAAGLVILCVIEQGMTLTSHDAAAFREAVARLARTIEDSRIAFYYRPCDGTPFLFAQVRAMWASLECGRPTIDGYSGSWPGDWVSFLRAEQDDGPELRDVIADWSSTHGLPLDRIQVIGAECLVKKRKPTRPEAPEGP